MGIHRQADLLMPNDSSTAVFQERRRAIRVHDAVALHVERWKDQPAAGEPAVAVNPVASASPNPTSPTHKCSLSAYGTAFASDLLLQPGELLLLRLTLFPAAYTIRTNARVISANDAPEIAHGDKPTYRVEFQSLADADRDFIEEHVIDLSRKRPLAD